MDDSHKIRRSTRDIKRPKFDDEIVQSIPVTNKSIIKKRPDRERSLQSPELFESPVPPPPPEEAFTPTPVPAPAPASVKPTPLRRKPQRHSWDKLNGSGPKESPTDTQQDASAMCDEPIWATPDRKRKEQIRAESASKPTASTNSQQQSHSQASQSAAGASSSSAAAANDSQDTLKRWTASDDVLLITGVTHICDLQMVHAQTKFSKPFTLHEIDMRWYEILYDETMSRATMARIESMPQEMLLSIQANIPYSTEEEEILSSMLMHIIPPPNAFENLLAQHRAVFHHARTPAGLESHWRSMKHWGLLADQTVQTFDDDLLRVERNYSLSAISKDDIVLPTDIEDKNFMHELQRGNTEVEEWERVVTRAVTGVNHAIQFDRDTMAVLKGRCVSFDIRKDRVLIGRSTQKHRVDVNLSYEGPTAAISRRQCLLKIEPGGRSLLFNLGEANVYVDRRLVRKTGRAELHHNSMIEIGPIRLLFARNEEAYRNAAKEAAKSPAVPPPAQALPPSKAPPPPPQQQPATLAAAYQDVSMEDIKPSL